MIYDDNGVEIIPGLQFGRDLNESPKPLEYSNYSSFGTLEEIEGRAFRDSYDGYKNLLKRIEEIAAINLSNEQNKALKDTMLILNESSQGTDVFVGSELLNLLRLYGTGLTPVLGKIPIKDGCYKLLEYTTYYNGNKEIIPIYVDKSLGLLGYFLRHEFQFSSLGDN
jgi:hypothetical protein